MTAFSFLAEAFLNSPEVSSVLVADESLFIVQVCGCVYVCMFMHVGLCVQTHPSTEAVSCL